jgi:Ca2+-binding RTX toxin-like protein
MLVGGPGYDTLDGASGFGEYDYLYGGPGDDVFYVDTPADLVFEFPDEGHDTVYTNIIGAGYYLYGDIEVLILLGTTPFGVGNASDNLLIGNAAANWLFGGAGDDTLDGQGSDDVLFGQDGADTFIIGLGTGREVIGDFTPGADRIALHGLGVADLDGLLALTVQYGANLLVRFAGGDTLTLHGVARSALQPGDFIFG